MPSTSKSKQRKGKKSKLVPKPKQRWQVKQQKRNWLDLPSDVTANILYRVGVLDILENAQKVCTDWRKICKDPAMWRVIYMQFTWDPRPIRKMYRHAVDRSQGQLVDITLVDFDGGLLKYVANRSSHRRLEIAQSYDDMYGVLAQALKKFPLLEELSLYSTKILKEDIETAGRYCPMLKTLKVNQRAFIWRGDPDEESIRICNEIAVAIGENLPDLKHLELIGNSMTNIGLQKILDGCGKLESLDLRQCLYINLKGAIGKRCSEQIKCLKLPNDSLEGCPYIYRNDRGTSGFVSDPELYTDDSDDEFDGYFDYDDSTDFDSDDYSDIENLDEMMIFMDMFG